MNFLQETRTFSALSIALLTLILVVAFLFVLQLDEERGQTAVRSLLARHQALQARLDAGEAMAALPIGEGDPALLGAGLIDLDGRGEFHPATADRFWRALLAADPDHPFPARLDPVRGGDLYFLPVWSVRMDRRFVTFFDGGRRRAEDLKLRTLSVIVLATAILMPFITWLFLRRAGRLYAAVVGEVGRSPVAGGVSDDPESVVAALRRTNDELVRLLEEAHHRAGELEVLAGTLSRSIASGLLVLDPAGRVLECNRQGLEILGREGAAPPDLGDLLAGWPAFREALGRALEERTIHSRLEVRDAGRDLGLNVAPLYAAGGGFLGTLVLFTDLTPWKRIEEELRVQSGLASLGAFASGIAHEFRNSLAALTGWMKLLRRDPPREKAREYLEAMVREADHINRVVTRFLDYSRLREIRRAPADLAELADEAVAGIEGQYPGVRFEVSGPPLVLDADGALLAQAVRAVVENACQADPGGTVRLSWRPARGGGARIEVADGGPGVPAEVRAGLFVPFNTSRPEGTGLGLALAHRIAVLHGGTLALDEGPGPGARFVFTLPGQLSRNETPPPPAVGGAGTGV
jgi:signal transduction histidine kinase